MQPRLRQDVAALLAALLMNVSLSSFGIGQEPMRCKVEADQGAIRVVVELGVPHADKMLLTTPDDRRIYLRDSDTPTRHPDIDDFATVQRFVIDRKTPGTWFNDWGEPELVKALGIAGQYKLLVADNLEKKSNQASAASCTFLLGP